MDEQAIKLRFLTVTFIGLAMIASVFVYAVVVEVLKRWAAPFSGFASLTPAQALMLKYVFMALAIGHFFAIKFLKRIFPASSLERLFQAAVITFALCEAVAIFGLVLFLLTGNDLGYYLFMFLSLFYFWYYFPKYQEWEVQLLSPSRPVSKKSKKIGGPG